MEQIIAKTGLSVDDTRLDKWLPIMEKWQLPIRSMEHRHEKEIPLIVDSIIANNDLDLQMFDLTILEQSLIMAHLMKDHGRRLLLDSSSFPKNAKTANSLLK